MKYPDKIIAFKNPDKEFQEEWTQGRNIANIPHSWRALIVGKPSSGKGVVLQNLILRQDPPFDNIICYHIDPDGTNEWDICDATMTDVIPEIEDFNPEEKNLLIIDDIDIKGLDKNDRSRLDRFFGYLSTHRNTSIALLAQDAFQITPNIRRMANIIVLFKPSDYDSINCLSRKVGMGSKELKGIFEKLMPDFHDSLMIDMTHKQL